MAYFLKNPHHLYYALFSSSPEWSVGDPNAEKMLLKAQLRVLLDQRNRLVGTANRQTLAENEEIIKKPTADSQLAQTERLERIKQVHQEMRSKQRRLGYIQAYQSRHTIIWGLIAILVLLYLITGGAKVYEKQEAEKRRIAKLNAP